jgi:hypothetical protein
MCKCIKSNCMKNAYYNYNNIKKKLYCNEHKLENMINVSRNKCIYNNCTNYAYYGYINTKGKNHCRIHRLENMVSYVKGNNNCIPHRIENIVSIHKSLKIYNKNDFNIENAMIELNYYDYYNFNNESY